MGGFRSLLLLGLICSVAAFAASDPSEAPEVAEVEPGFVPTEQYEIRSIEGWTIHVNKVLLAEDNKIGQPALRLLTSKLYEITRVVPEPALGELRKVPIWLGVDDGHTPVTEYHSSREWLRQNGYNPDKAKAVEIGSAERFFLASYTHPSLVLHELAHAYHDRVLGANHPAILKAYRAALESGRYEKVLCLDGAEARSYALANPQEYFAEGAAAFFATNYSYPFVRAELYRHGPELFRLLAELWQVEIELDEGP